MDNLNDIERKDKGKQCTVHLNTVTFYIISGSISALGEQYGIEVKNNDIDLKGTEEKDQYNLSLVKGSLKIPITMTFYHTTGNVLVQLKGKKREARWAEKLDAFEEFVSTTLK